MAYYKVMAAGECYGISDTYEKAQDIIEMRKSEYNHNGKGTKTPAKCASLAYVIETCDGEYPSKDKY